MSKTENIKLYIKKSGDCYKVVNEKMYSNSNSLTPNKTNKKCSTKKIKDKGNEKFQTSRSWISCPCIYCNVKDEDKIILAAQFALEQAKKEITIRRAKVSKKYR